MIRCLYCLAFFLCLVAAPAQALSLSDGLICYLPSDGTAAPRYAAGARNTSAPQAVPSEGKVGQSLSITTEGIAVPGAGNFSRPHGTVAFWVKLAWNPADVLSGSHTLFSSENFQLTYQADKHVLFFMTGSSKPAEGYQWDYSTADFDAMRTWAPSEWHQVVAAWDAAAQKKTLYLDGHLVSAQTTDLIRRDPFQEAGFISLGSAGAPGAYDELMLWDRPLSAVEVGILFKQPAETAKMLQSALPQIAGAPAWPVLFELIQAEHPQETVVVPGRTYLSRFAVKNPSAKAWAGIVTYRLLDFYEKPRGQKRLPLTLAPGDRREIAIPFTAPERGVFKVEAKIIDGGKVWTRDVAAFAAWPNPTHPPRLGSFFGSHINSWGEDVLAQAEHLGIGWNRDHNMLQATWWPRVEPEQGVWAFNHDFQLQNNKKHHMAILGQFFGTPYWAAASGLLPKQEGPEFYPYGVAPDLKAFREYVTRTVSRYKNDIHVWEIWNEPEVSSFWNGSPEQFAALCEAAYKAAKAADPTCTVVQGGYTNSAYKWHEAAAKAGAFRWGDVVSAHYYYDPGASAEDLFHSFQTGIDHYRDLSTRYGRGPKTLFWNTEGGTGDTSWLRGLDFPDLPPAGVRSPLNWREGAISTVEAAAIQQSLGVVRWFYYIDNPGGLNADSYQSLSMLDATLAPKPKMMALAAMAAQVDGTKYAGTVRHPAGHFWAVVYAKPNRVGSLVLWWTGKHGKVHVSAKWPGRVIKETDFLGNDHPASNTQIVTDEPSYLHLNAAPTAVLQALRTASLTILTPPEALAAPVAVSDKPDIPALPSYAAPAENAAGVFTIDLKPYANLGFFDPTAGDGVGGWADEGPFNSPASMPLGRQKFYGVPFDIIDPKTNGGKAILTLRGKNATPRFPLSIENIALGGNTVRVLYFLHSSAWGAAGNLGQYVIHYIDGQSVTAPIDIPNNNGNWWSGWQPQEQSRPVGIRVTNTADGKPAWRYLRVWEWQNPHPNIPLQSLDYVSSGGESTPILLAVSGIR